MNGSGGGKRKSITWHASVLRPSGMSPVIDSSSNPCEANTRSLVGLRFRISSDEDCVSRNDIASSELPRGLERSNECGLEEFKQKVA